MKDFIEINIGLKSKTDEEKVAESVGNILWIKRAFQNEKL